MYSTNSLYQENTLNACCRLRETKLLPKYKPYKHIFYESNFTITKIG